MRSRLPVSPFMFILLGGCSAGLDYTGPPSIVATAGQAPSFVRGDSNDAGTAIGQEGWWSTFGDPVLDALVADARARNPSIDVIEARLRQARSALREERANGLPSASASALYAHARLAGTDARDASAIDLFNLGFDTRWEVDIFGGQRRKTEAARAEVGRAKANVDDALISLSAEVVRSYALLRGNQSRLALLQQATNQQEQYLTLFRQRFDQGAASRLEVSRASADLADRRATIASLHADQEGLLDVLATLTGRLPGELDERLLAPAHLLVPPAALPVADPASLLLNRPDIRAAERDLAAATARVGVADAARYPSISLLGIIGIGGSKPSDLARLDDFTLIAAPQLNWSFLDFGRARASIDQAKGRRDEADAHYRETVLAAIRETEDGLARFRNGRVMVAARARAKSAADVTAALSVERYRAGTTSLLDLLDAQQQQADAARRLVEAETDLTVDITALAKALALP